MQEYTVQKGDTIAKVTNLLGSDWKNLKSLNPNAVGRSQKSGNWFFKEGATIRTDAANKTFAQNLAEAQQQTPPSMANNIRIKTAPAQIGGSTIEHTVKPGETVWELAVKRYHVHVEDILKENNITDPRSLSIGQKLRIPLPEKPESQEVVASWYGKQFHGRDMANGVPFDMHANTIAHKELPLGTSVELENPTTGQKERAIITDRGPYVNGRDVDLSYGLATKLSLAKQGVGSLIMRVL